MRRVRAGVQTCIRRVEEEIKRKEEESDEQDEGLIH
jgi:hypothetical protein